MLTEKKSCKALDVGKKRTEDLSDIRMCGMVLILQENSFEIWMIETLKIKTGTAYLLIFAELPQLSMLMTHHCEVFL